MSEKDYLKEAKTLVNKRPLPEPSNQTSQRVIALALLDIAKTLREIKAMAEREVEDE